MRVHQLLTGRGNHSTTQGAKTFMRRWPHPQDWAAQPLAYRLAEGSQTTSFLIFLMVHGWLQPGYDYLVSRKLSSFWREVAASPLAADMERFRQGAEAIGFTPIQSLRMASQSVGRLLIETNVSLEQLTLDDFDALARACRRRGLETGKGWRHYQGALSGAHRVLFHLGILDAPPPHWQQPKAFAARVVDVHPALQPAFVAYLERKTGTCKPKTVTGMATRLVHFGRFLAEHDPELTSLADLDRQRHIEPYLNSVASCDQLQERRADHDRRSGPADLDRLGLPQRRHRVGMERRTEAAAHIPHGHPASAKASSSLPARRRRPASR